MTSCCCFQLLIPSCLPVLFCVWVLGARLRTRRLRNISIARGRRRAGHDGRLALCVEALPIDCTPNASAKSHLTVRLDRLSPKFKAQACSLSPIRPDARHPRHLAPPSFPPLFHAKPSPLPPTMPATTQPANPAARNTFDVRPLVGAHFNNPAIMRVESAAVAMEGRRLFVGTADGCVRVSGEGRGGGLVSIGSRRDIYLRPGSFLELVSLSTSPLNFSLSIVRMPQSIKVPERLRRGPADGERHPPALLPGPRFQGPWVVIE